MAAMDSSVIQKEEEEEEKEKRKKKPTCNGNAMDWTCFALHADTIRGKGNPTKCLCRHRRKVKVELQPIRNFGTR
jgi:hypothetical protein